MNKTLVLCPVDDCFWTLDATPPDVSQGALAEIFGWGVFAASAASRHHAQVERDIEAHLKMHSMHQFVTTIQRLKRECGEEHALRSAFDRLAAPPSGAEAPAEPSG